MAQSGGEGEQGEYGEGKGDGEEAGEECDPSTDPDCKPNGGGGESKPLTFGEIRNVDMSNASTSQLSGDTQVDWENTVQLGQGAGRRAEMGAADDGVVATTSTGAGSATSVEIPPSRRRTVQQFFSEDSDE